MRYIYTAPNKSYQAIVETNDNISKGRPLKCLVLKVFDSQSSSFGPLARQWWWCSSYNLVPMSNPNTLLKEII